MTIKYQFLFLLNWLSLRHVSKGIIGYKSFQFSKLLMQLGRDLKKAPLKLTFPSFFVCAKNILNWQSGLQHFDYDDHYQHIKQ